MSEGHIDTAHPASGTQHLRLSHDPTTRTNQPNFGLGVDARYPRAADLSVQPEAAITVSVDIAISGPGGQNFRIQPQSNSQGCSQGSVLFYETGEIYVLDDLCGTETAVLRPTGFQWDTTGAYRNFTLTHNPSLNLMEYYYGGQLIYSGCTIFGTVLDQFLVFGDNYPGSVMDVDNVVLQTDPPVCGDGFIAEPQGEQCEPGDDTNCPGRCIAQGQPGECTCTPICTEDEPCPLQNGENGPYLTSGGVYSYTPASPFVSVDTCGSDFENRISIDRTSDGSQLAFAFSCNDASAACYPSGQQSCVCFQDAGEPLMIRVYQGTSGPPAGSTVFLNIRKKSECAGASVGACCDTNGPGQGCTDNATAADCVGADKVWTDQGKCDEVLCECIADCTGATCGSDGCGGVCGTCDDANVCNGSETCNANRTCDAGTPLDCNDSNACNGVESCNPVSGCRPGLPLICNDGEFCNGVESCESSTGCVPGTHPCSEDETCDEDADMCAPITIPTVSTWGLVVLALVLLVAAKVRFGRVRRVS